MRIIKDPEVVQVVVERVRWKIWNLLKTKGSSTAEEIAEELNKDISTIYRHLKKLIDADFVTETEIRKGKQKYFVKKFSAKLTDSLFLLSEAEERMIASNPGEIPYLKGFLPCVLKVFKEIGLRPSSSKEEKKALNLMNEFRIGYSNFLDKLFGEKEEFPTLQRGEDFNEVLEYLEIFLVLSDEDFFSKINELMKILIQDESKFKQIIESSKKQSVLLSPVE